MDQMEQGLNGKAQAKEHIWIKRQKAWTNGYDYFQKHYSPTLYV